MTTCASTTPSPCRRKAYCKGLCVAHYNRERRRAGGAEVRDGPIRPAGDLGERIASTLRLPVDLYEAAAVLAHQRGVPIGHVVEVALRRYLSPGRRP